MTPTRLADDDNKKPEAAAAGPGRLEEQLAFKSRYVLVFGEIDDQLARRVCERLILLAQDSDAPIQMLISSPGGSSPADHVAQSSASSRASRKSSSPESCRFSKRVNSLRKARRAVPCGPLRCLAMMTSAIPSSGDVLL